MQNGFVESFNGRLRDERLNTTMSRSLAHLGMSGLERQSVATIKHGDADESVPLEQGRWLFDRTGGQKELCIMPGAPHCCWETPFENDVQRLSVEWFQEWLSGAYL